MRLGLDVRYPLGKFLLCGKCSIIDRGGIEGHEPKLERRLVFRSVNDFFKALHVGGNGLVLFHPPLDFNWRSGCLIAPIFDICPAEN